MIFPVHGNFVAQELQEGYEFRAHLGLHNKHNRLVLGHDKGSLCDNKSRANPSLGRHLGQCRRSGKDENSSAVAENIAANGNELKSMAAGQGPDGCHHRHFA